MRRRGDPPGDRGAARCARGGVATLGPNGDPGCEYANFNAVNMSDLGVYRLQEVAFGSSSPVVVGSQAHAVVPIGGVDSDVWVWDSGAIMIVAR
jgi:hypothetical protein